MSAVQPARILIVDDNRAIHEDFRKILLSGKLDETWGEIALKTQRVMDACVNSARDKGRPVGVN